jgi:nitrite reductase/ring-hydroxylating ferredoxin subunit
MDRRKFIHHSCLCSITGIAVSGLTNSCTSIKYSSGTILDSDLLIPLEDFVDRSGTEIQYRQYVIASNEILKFPVCVYRFSDTEYKALWPMCTHQGSELQVFGDSLICPAHGSEFDSAGNVLSGPAEEPLRVFPVIIDGDYLKISLKK